MVAMVQRLDARGLFFRSQLSVCTVSALVLEVFRNRFSCHRCSVADLSSSELSNSSHSLTIHGPPRGDRLGSVMVCSSFLSRLLKSMFQFLQSLLDVTGFNRLQ